jgi:hypothetical protein
MSMALTPSAPPIADSGVTNRVNRSLPRESIHPLRNTRLYGRDAAAEHVGQAIKQGLGNYHDVELDEQCSSTVLEIDAIPDVRSVPSGCNQGMMGPLIISKP